MERGSFHYKEKMVEGYNILATKKFNILRALPTSLR